MKKIFLVAGFFILTSSSESFAKATQIDTLPNNKTFPCCKLSDTDLRLSFLQWRNMQMGNVFVNRTTIDLRSHPYLQPGHSSEFHLTWWPQVIQLNSNRSLLPDLRLADIALELYRSSLHQH